MIEFVTPREGAFGASDMADFVGLDGQQATEFGDEPPRSPWLLAVATIVVTALIGVGIIAAAPWDSAPQTAPPTTIAAVTPTAAATPESTDATPSTPPGSGNDRFAEVATEPAGLLLDNPGSLQLSGVYSDPTAASEADDMSPIDLWLMPDATRSSGRWLAVTINLGSPPVVTDATRFDLMGRAALLATSADGVFTLHFSAGDGTKFEVAGFGFTIDELVRIASTVHAEGSAISYGDLVESGGPLESFPPPESGVTSSWDGLVGSTVGALTSSAYYVDPYRPRFVGVVTAQSDPRQARRAQFLLPPWPAAMQHGISRTTSITSADGTERSVSIGSLPDQGVDAVAQWIDGNHIVTVFGTDLSPAELLTLAADARTAGPDEWRDLVIQSFNGELQVTEVPSADRYTKLGSITTADGTEFGVMASEASLELSSPDFSALVTRDGGPEPRIRSYSNATVTFVVAASSWPAGGERTLRVQLSTVVNGGAMPLPAVEIPMVQIAETTEYIAVHGFSEIADGVAEIIDADGTIVATLEL